MLKENELKLIKRVLSVIFLLTLSYGAHAFDNIVVVGLFKDKAVIQIDGKRRLLAVGETSPEGVTVISANSREAVIEFNDTRKTLTLGSHIGSRFQSPTGKRVVTIAPDAGGLYWTNGSINDFQVKFIVDTGASMISMNKHEAKRIGLNYKMEGKQSVSSTASGISKIYLINLKKVKVGDIELRDVNGSVHDGDFPEFILLGNSFLSKVNLQREGGLLRLEK